MNPVHLEDATFLWQLALGVSLFCAVLGVIVSSSMVKKDEVSEGFFPKRVKPLVYGGLIGAAAGFSYVYFDVMAKSYEVVCEPGPSVRLRFAWPKRDLVLEASDIIRVSPALVGYRGQRPWSIRVYYGKRYAETQRIDDRDLKKLREWFATCLAGEGARDDH